MRSFWFFILPVFLFLLFFNSCKSKEEKARIHLETGIDLTRKSDMQGALVEFNEAIRYDPDNADAWYYRGNTNYNLFEVEKAIADYDKAIELNPEHIEALVNRGNARVYNGDIEGGCLDWRKAESLGKDNLEHKLKFCK